MFHHFIALVLLLPHPPSPAHERQWTEYCFSSRPGNGDSLINPSPPQNGHGNNSTFFIPLPGRSPSSSPGSSHPASCTRRPEHRSPSEFQEYSSSSHISLPVVRTPSLAPSPLPRTSPVCCASSRSRPSWPTRRPASSLALALDSGTPGRSSC